MSVPTLAHSRLVRLYAKGKENKVESKDLVPRFLAIPVLYHRVAVNVQGRFKGVTCPWKEN